MSKRPESSKEKYLVYKTRIYYCIKTRTGNSKSGYPEQPQNSYESMPIAVHPNCHLSQWLPFSSHSRLLTLGLTVLYSNLYGFLHSYLSSYRRLFQVLKPIRFLTMLFAIIHCCLFQFISVYTVVYF